MIIHKLAEGIYHLPEYISSEMQAQILEWYDQNLNLFYYPLYKGQYKMSVKMCCLGKHWSAVDNKYHDFRIDYDHLPVPPLPDWLSTFGQNIVENLYPHQHGSLDIAVVNVYTSQAKLGMHRDNSESLEALNSGYPVVSLSLGLPAKFDFRVEGKVHSLELKHADVICFGDRNRLMHHGISQVASQPSISKLNGVRLNFTLRKL